MVAHELMEAAVASDRMTNAMTAATGSTAQGAAELQFVRIEAQRLGLDLLSSADAFVSLAASAKGTRLEGQGARDIFSAVSEASTTLGLSADKTSGALLAIQQMISKGTVAAEELRGQLGERLPGAFQIAARAMGVSTAELGKLLEGGKVVAEDFLPKFAEELKKTFGASEAATHSAQAEINRFNSAIFDMKKAIIDQGGADALKTLVVWGTSTVGVFRDIVFEVSDAKIRIADLFHRIAAVAGDETSASLLTKAGRAELAAELAAQDQMFEWQIQKLEERRTRAMTAPPPGAPGGGAGGGPDADARKKAESHAKHVAKLNDQIQAQINKITLSPLELIDVQANAWLKEGADRIKVEAWVAGEKEKINDAAMKKAFKQLDEKMDKEAAADAALLEAKAQIAEKEFQARVEWQNRLDEMKVKKGALSEDAALTNRYDRERQLLNVQQETLAVQIDQEKSETRRLELESEYYQLGEQILQNHQEEAFSLYELKIKQQERLNELSRLEIETQRTKYEEAWAQITALANQAGMGRFAGNAKAFSDAAMPSQAQPGIDAAAENAQHISQNLPPGEEKGAFIAEQQKGMNSAIAVGEAENNPYMAEVLRAAEAYAQHLEIYRQFATDKKALTEEGLAAEAGLNEAYNNLKTAQDGAAQNQKLGMLSAGFGMMASMAQSFYTLSGNQSKAALVAHKAFSIAQAVISTYTGAANALATVVYPLNFVAAASVVAAGLAQVSSIMSAQPGGTPARPSMPSAVTPRYPSTPTLPEYGQADAPTKTPVQQWNITFVGGTYIGSDKDAIARDLTPAIMKAIGDGVH